MNTDFEKLLEEQKRASELEEKALLKAKRARERVARIRRKEANLVLETLNKFSLSYTDLPLIIGAVDMAKQENRVQELIQVGTELLKKEDKTNASEPNHNGEES